MLFVHLERKDNIGMFVEESDSTRSIARKLAREILPDELDVIAAGTTTLSGPDHLPGDMDQGGIA
jgi:hypothetical protein